MFYKFSGLRGCYEVIYLNSTAFDKVLSGIWLRNGLCADYMVIKTDRFEAR